MGGRHESGDGKLAGKNAGTANWSARQSKGNSRDKQRKLLIAVEAEVAS
jgi:hypothetical protein